MSSDKKISLSCKKHPGELITNFDSHLDHLVELCPECIDDQNKKHILNQTHPQIESLKIVKVNTQKKIQTALQFLDEMVNKVESQQGQGNEGVNKQIYEKIQQAKHKVNQLIATYFKKLEECLQQKQNDQSANSESNQFMIKCRQLMAELKKTNEEIESSINIIEGIRKACRMDLTKSIDRLKKQQNQILTSDSKQQLILKVDDEQLQKIDVYLQKYAFFIDDQQKPLQISMNNSQIIEVNPMSISSQIRYSLKSPTRGSIKMMMDQSNIKQKIELTSPESFQQDSNKFLHFFEQNSKNLHIADLENIYSIYCGLKKKPDNISIFTSIIKVYHQKMGQIYLIGGTIDKDKKNKDIYIYDSSTKKLLKRASLQIGRSSHSIVSIQDLHILIVGGYTEGQIITNRCELYNLNDNTVTEINRCKIPTVSSCLTYINSLVFKFGGLNSQYLPNQEIECLNWSTKEWRQIKYTNPSNLQFNSTCISIALNTNQIFICGGYDHQNEASNQSILCLYTNGQVQLQKDCDLPKSEGFWNSQGIYYMGNIFVLQNELDQDLNCKQDERQILVFNGSNWFML